VKILAKLLPLPPRPEVKVALSTDPNSLKHRLINHGRVVTENRRTARDACLTPAGPGRMQQTQTDDAVHSKDQELTKPGVYSIT